MFRRCVWGQLLPLIMVGIGLVVAVLAPLFMPRDPQPGNVPATQR